MKILCSLLILFAIPTFANAQEPQKDTITFTEIFVDEEDGSSEYLAYTDSQGNEHFSDLVYPNPEIVVDGRKLFVRNMGLVEFFDEEYANQLLGKKVVVSYQLKTETGFGPRKYVTNMQLLK